MIRRCGGDKVWQWWRTESSSLTTGASDRENISEGEAWRITPLAWPGSHLLMWTEHSGPPPHTHTKKKKSNSSRSKAVIFKRAFAHLMMHDSFSLLFIPNECVGGCEGWMELRVCGREEGEQFQRPGVDVCRQTGVVGTEGATDCLKGSRRYFLYLKGIFP